MECSDEKKEFFFKKKNQKTFIRLPIEAATSSHNGNG